ncbi:MAG: sulfite exporter TauE/SafE family protein [Actinobacteria bacterium]|nr:MAG: sulfite exporter TauE/SafE family protein [Actinomycetota bacterium]REK32947.1 MAG: sulfite exporter TauE/SafE family protein [Actinomycetota bacterium]
MIELSPLVWVLVLGITAGAAAIQGTVGIGYGLVAVPILALIDPRLSPVPQLLTVVPLTVAMAWNERHALDFGGVWWLLGGRLPGAALGLALLAVATQRTLDLFIGLTVLLAVVLLVSGLRVTPNPVTQFGAGVASGTTSLVASIGGPPTALLYAGQEAPTVRSTLSAVFTIGVLLSIAVRAFSNNIASSDVMVAAVMLPAVLFGWAVSRRYKDRFSSHGVRLGVFAVSGLAAVGLVIRALA